MAAASSRPYTAVVNFATALRTQMGSLPIPHLGSSTGAKVHLFANAGSTSAKPVTGRQAGRQADIISIFCVENGVITGLTYHPWARAAAVTT